MADTREIIDIEGHSYTVIREADGSTCLLDPDGTRRTVVIMVERIRATVLSIYSPDDFLIAREVSMIDDVEPAGTQEWPEGRWQTR